MWMYHVSSLGQGLKPSSYYGEILFSYLITIIGWILLALIIGNMQKYLQTFSHLTLRLEEMKEARRRRDAEEFMSCVSLPEELRQRVRRYKHYKWKITKGVELDTIVRDLPRDIRRDIKRHLCLPSLHRVEFFSDMEDKLLDMTCELMKPVFYPRNSQITRVGYPIGEMVFITRGRVNMTNGYGVELYFGCFFGEEILEWVLHPESSPSSGVLPISARTVTAITDVQAFALGAEEMKFLASHFNDSTRTSLKHALKYCSRERRIWAVECIQGAWRSHCRRKLEKADDYIEAAWRRWRQKRNLE